MSAFSLLTVSMPYPPWPPPFLPCRSLYLHFLPPFAFAYSAGLMLSLLTSWNRLGDSAVGSHSNLSRPIPTALLRLLVWWSVSLWANPTVYFLLHFHHLTSNLHSETCWKNKWMQWIKTWRQNIFMHGKNRGRKLPSNSWFSVFILFQKALFWLSGTLLFKEKTHLSFQWAI